MQTKNAPNAKRVKGDLNYRGTTLLRPGLAAKALRSAITLSRGNGRFPSRPDGHTPLVRTAPEPYSPVIPAPAFTYPGSLAAVWADYSLIHCLFYVFGAFFGIILQNVEFVNRRRGFLCKFTLYSGKKVLYNVGWKFFMVANYHT